jgi:Rhodopirellula transposase DDE domain
MAPEMITQSSNTSRWGARLSMSLWDPFLPPALTPSQIQDLRLAASKMTGAARRAFQAEMTLKYCRGSARLAETILGWSREAVAVGVAEHRTGMRCVGAQSACSGRKRWEEHEPEAAEALRQLAEAHAQQDPTLRTTLAYTRLTAKAALEALRAHGVSEDHLPSPSTMAEVLHRMGYRLRKVLTAKPQKKIKATDAIFDHIKKRPPVGGHGAGQTLAHGLYSHGQYWRVLARGVHPW